MVRVLIVDDNPLVRRSYRALLQREDNIEIVGEARDGVEAIECARTLQPDVVLMDIRMPNMDGLLAAAKMQAMGLPSRVIIVSLYADDTWVRAAFERGTRGYILKQNTFNEMVRAIQQVAAGGIFLSPQLEKVKIAAVSMNPLNSDAEHN